MSLVRLTSVLLIPCAAGILTVGCGQASTSLSPTAPSAVLSSTALTQDGGPQMSTMASSGAGFSALGRGNGNGHGNGNGQGNGQGGGSSNPQPGGPEVPGGSDDEERGNNGVLSGFVTAVGASSLMVHETTVTIGLETVIRHGNRMLTIADIHVGNHVQVRGIMNGPTLLASEIKVEPTGRDDGGSGEEPDAQGVVSARAGTCPSLTFMVGTTRVTTSSATLFDGVACSAVVNGVTVEVEGTVLADGSIAATKVEVVVVPAEVMGIVAGLAGTCPNLTFMIGTTSVTTSSTTTFGTGVCTAVVNGVSVKATGTKQADGSIIAATVAF